MASDVKAGGAYVELMTKDKGFVAGLSKAKQHLIGFAKGAAIMGAAVGAAGAAFAAVGLRNVLSLGDQLAKMSQRTGLTVEALSQLKHAAEQSGTSIETVEKALRFMQSKGMDPAQFDAIAASIAAIEDPTERAKAAMDAWGKKAGPALLPMLADLPALKREAQDLGLVMSGETANAAVRVGDMFANLWETVKQLSIQFGAAFLPFLEVALPVLQQFGTAAIGITTQVVNFLSQAWVGFVNAVSPIFAGLYVVAAEVFNGIATVVGAAWSYVSDSTGGVMAWLQSTIMSVLSAVSFAWNNWQLLLQTALVSAELSVVRFANQVVYFFTEMVPAYLSWFRDNWRDVFTDILNLTATIASNIWENLKNLWAAIGGLLSGEGWDFNWTPLTKGFESAIKELPQVAAREMGPLEKQLQDEMNSLGEEVNKAWEDNTKEFGAKIDKYAPKVAELAGIGAKVGEQGAAEIAAVTPAAGASKEKTFASFSAAALAAQGAGGGVDPGSERVARAVEKAAREQEKRDNRLAARLEDGGGLTS